MQGGFWRTDHNFEATLHLKNVLLNHSLVATPTIFMADGTAYELTPMTLEPAGTGTLNISSALHTLPADIESHRSDFGMMGIKYNWSWPGALLATVEDIDEIAMLSFHSALLSDLNQSHAVSPADKPQRIDGTWWKPYSSADGFLAISNTMTVSKEVKITLVDLAGNAIKQQVVVQQPESTTKMTLSYLFDDPPAVDSAGGIVLSYRGPRNSILAFGGVEDETRGFSATIHFEESHPEQAREHSAHSIVLDGAGIIIGNPPPKMAFPEGTSFEPYAIVRNTSEQQRIVNLSLTYSQDSAPTTKEISQIALTAGAAYTFNLKALLSKAGLSSLSGAIDLSLQYDGHDGDVQLASGSVDQSGNYVFEVEPQGEVWTVAKTICYWTVFRDMNTMISLWNYTPDPETLTLTLYYSGGKYVIPIQLAPRSDYELDLASMIRSGRADAAGTLIPANITEGSAVLADAEDLRNHISVATSTSTFNVRNGTCTNQCGTCGGVTSFFSVPQPVTIGVNSSQQVQGQLTYSWGSTYTVTNGLWSTGNTSIATVNSTGVVTGRSPGPTDTFQLIENLPVNLGYICMGNALTCPTQSMQMDAPTQVQIPHQIYVQNDVIASANCPIISTQRTITYQILDSSSTPMYLPVQIRENVPVTTTSTCTNKIISTGQSCTYNNQYYPGNNNEFNDFLFPGCPPSIAQTPCGFTFSDQQWLWCPNGGTPTSIGNVGTDVVHNDIISVDGNTISLKGARFGP